MIGYFENFQRTSYSLDSNDANIKQITNILHRSAFLKKVAENTTVFYEYQMKETDTPEIIADKLYGDPNRHWIILLFNSILNPFYSLPLRNDVLEEYIKNKYSQTLAQSQLTIHHYELSITKNITKSGTFVSSNTEKYTVNGNSVAYSTGKISTRSLPGVADTYIESAPVSETLPDGSICTTVERITAISNYGYEVNENEKRRNIKLIDKEYIPAIEAEFTKLMQNG